MTMLATKSRPTRPRKDRTTGRRIRALRVNRGLSPEQLGNQIGVSGRTIRRVEDGATPTVRTMFLIAQEFDLEVTDLWRL